MSAATKTQIDMGPAATGKRGFLRFAPIALIAGFVLIASLAVASAASAAEGPPVNHVTGATAEYTTAHVTGTVESDVTPGFSDEFASLWAFEYAVKGTPPNGSWTGNPCCNGQIAPSGKAPVEAELTGLKPDTEYEVRLGSFNGYNGFAYTTSEELEPNHVITTKHVDKPSVTLAISDVTLDSAHFSGTVQTNSPAGPLSAAQKAAYQTTWNVVCRPQCPTVAESVVIEGDEAGGPVSLDPIRLETNTYYEVELIATNSAGSVTTEEFFTTPNIAPKITPAPGGSSGKGAYSIGGVVTPYNTKITDCHFEYGPTTEYVYSAPCSPQPVGRNEYQAFAIAATAGQFRLVFRGQETGDIAVGADEKIVEEELQALSTIGPEGVTEVAREFGFFFVAYYVHFSGPLSGTNLGPIKIINGTHTVFIEGQGIPPACCTGDTLGFSGAIVEGGNNDPVVVEAHLTGLTPGATYHYKIFATNNVGTVTSEDIRFVAPLAVGDKPCPNEAVRIENNSTRLPECRAYELVTSAFKASYGCGAGAAEHQRRHGGLHVKSGQHQQLRLRRALCQCLCRSPTRQRLGNDLKPEWPAGLVLRSPQQSFWRPAGAGPVQHGSPAVGLVPVEEWG